MVITATHIGEACIDYLEEGNTTRFLGRIKEILSVITRYSTVGLEKDVFQHGRDSTIGDIEMTSLCSLHGENDIVASTKRFVNIVSANQNCTGDNFSCYINNMNCYHNKDSF